MFRCYANAHICYAYLSDYGHDVNAKWEIEFAKSSWVERAWTLQELIAPTSVMFFDRSWNPIGFRSDLCGEIAEASGINHLELFTMKSPDLNDWSIAQRFSWASQRKATWTEDLAYSLLGIFDVNLALLYGEGIKAFQRLQEAIVQQTNDQTIFAWSGSDDLTDLTSIFAPSAAAFQHDHFLRPKSFDEISRTSLSNLGLTIGVRLQFWTLNIAWAGLNCTRNGFDQVGIFIFRNGQTADIWNKCRVGGKFWEAIERDDAAGEYSGVTLAVRLSFPLLERKWPIHKALEEYINPRFSIDTSVPLKWNLAMGSTGNQNGDNDPSTVNVRWTQSRRAVLEPLDEKGPVSYYAYMDVNSFAPCGGSLVAIEYLDDRSCIQALMLGVDSHLRPFCILAEPHHAGVRNGTEDMDDLIDRSLSLHLKSFWQCSGLEEEGWIYSQDKMVQHPGHLREGLWALKGIESNTVGFRLNLGHRKIQILLHANSARYRPRYHWGFELRYIDGDDINRQSLKLKFVT